MAEWTTRENDSNQRVELPVFGDCELVMVTGASPQVDRWYRADSTGYSLLGLLRPFGRYVCMHKTGMLIMQ